jgi:hypothetical protein
VTDGRLSEVETAGGFGKTARHPQHAQGAELTGIEGFSIRNERFHLFHEEYAKQSACRVRDLVCTVLPLSTEVIPFPPFPPLAMHELIFQSALPNSAGFVPVTAHKARIANSYFPFLFES